MNRQSAITQLKFQLIQSQHLWLKPAAVAGALLASAMIAYLTTEKSIIALAIIVLPFGVAGLLILLRWPPLGLLVLLASVLVWIDGPSGLNASTLMAAALLGLWFLDMLMYRRGVKIPLADHTFAPLLALAVVPFLALLVGQLPWYPAASHAPLGAQIAGGLLYLFSVGIFWVVGYRVNDERWLHRSVLLFTAIGAFYLSGSIVPLIGKLTERIFNPYAVGSLFWTWLTAVTCSQILFNRDLKLIWRGMLAILLLLAFYVAYRQNNDWKSGWVPMVVVVGCLFVLWSWRLAALFTVGGIAAVPVVIAKLIASDAYSYSTRLDAWVIVLEIIKVNPVLGLGPANYYWYTPLFPIRGYAVQFNSHNQYIDLIAQTGLVGLATFLWVFAAIAWLGWQIKDKMPTGFSRAYVYGGLAGLVGTLVAAMLGDWVIPFFYNITFRGFRASMLGWFFLGGLLALKRMYVQEQK